MSTSEAQKKATERYKGKLEEVRFYVPRGDKQKIRDFAESKGMSVNEFLRGVVKAAMDEKPHT